MASTKVTTSAQRRLDQHRATQKSIELCYGLRGKEEHVLTTTPSLRGGCGKNVHTCTSTKYDNMDIALD